jgi:hypothetical protein
MRSASWWRRSEGAVAALRRAIGPAPSARLREELSRPDFPWTDLAHAANSFLLTPAMPWRLAAHGVEDLVPPDLREYFEATAVLNAGKAEEGQTQIGRIAATLNAAGIRPMALKSAAGLVESLYPSPGCRILRDLDLLVPEGRLEDAVAALESAGYRPLPSGLDLWRRHAGSMRHYPRLFHEGETRGLDLHARVLDGPCREALPTAELFARGREIDWRGSRLVLPSIRDQIAHTVLHATEFVGTWTIHGAQPVRRLIDLALLFERLSASERAPLAETLRRVGGSWRLNLCLAFAGVWVGLAPPPELQARAVDRCQQSLFRLYAQLSLRRGPTLLRQAAGRALKALKASLRR